MYVREKGKLTSFHSRSSTFVNKISIKYYGSTSNYLIVYDVPFYVWKDL